MDRISFDDLRSLVKAGTGPRVSIYVTQEGGPAAAEGNSQQLRHALFQAETKLKDDGFDATLTNSLLQPALDLVRSGQLSQATGSKGLAVLLAPGVFQHWPLPFACAAAVDVGPDFHVTPLVRLLNWPLDVRVVAFSSTNVRFFLCTRDAIHKLELPAGTPASLDQFEGGPDVGRAVRFQTTAGAAGATNMIHGQASFKDEAETRLQAYVRTVAQQIGESVKHEKLPLVLVAAKELHPIFTDAFGTEGLLEPGIIASPAHLSEAEIHEQVVRLVDTLGSGELKVARDRYQSATERHQACSVHEEIVPAAVEGRVDTLIVADGERVWGLWDEASQRALVASGTSQARAVDLLDLAVRETLGHGGRVCVVPRSDIPEQAQAVAVFRWVSPVEAGAQARVVREGL